MRLKGHTPQLLGTILVLTGIYVLAAKLGLSLAFIHPSATPVWPPTGITLAALLILGNRVWPGILLGAFLANITTAGSVTTSLAIAGGNTLEGLVGAYLVNRFANGPHFCERPQDIFKFTLLAGVVSTMVSASIGVTTLALSGLASWTDYTSIWLTWWLGDAMGDFIIAPLLMLWSENPSVRWNRYEIFELALLLLLLFLGGQMIFGGVLPTNAKNYPLDFLCVPVLVWAAFRFGPRETATTAVMLSGIALWGTLHGFGPFAKDTLNESLLLLQLFMGCTAVMALVFAVVVLDRKRAEEVRARLAAIVESSVDAIVGITMERTVVSWNRAAERLFGYPAGEAIGSPISFVMPPDRVHEENQIIDRLKRDEYIDHFETVQRRKDGQEFPVSLTISPIKDATGKIIGASKSVRDISDKKRAEEQIQASLREKEVLLREIHHRVKNNLQVIYSLLRLQSKLVTDPKASALFKDSQARVKAMALVHETLWQSKNLSRIDMSEYSRTLTRRLFESYGISSDTLGLNLNIAPVSFSMETAVSCGQLINELVSNCLKHAFPNGRTGDVTVELLSNGNDTYLLTVSDNGVGLPPDFEVGKAESLGWQLVPMLVEQLNGTFELQESAGTTVRLTISEILYTGRI
jgi:PAS domain S-box-containing protein